ncbi:hypothetical protein MCOR02_001200 [Pyricularia oryzae]|uniref:Uncharacterized protein n=1 Tax=Pyricularia oryzae TaxID=318829 RepID=A0A4P7N3D1_PYROR|nr:hypothetical protein MCOR02_001200 [Pyricularia oryzae]KAI6579759.1 hypothetical protein MCOR04_005950 [Pyricularia oryzae]KAI6633661.1 hypothetical protein MCOR08_004976 [Pyricularia oryzae]QBZ55156.1 hypothetical protein PoMZ_00048 [Pyricularia oryzae]
MEDARAWIRVATIVSCSRVLVGGHSQDVADYENVLVCVRMCCRLSPTAAVQASRTSLASLASLVEYWSQALGAISMVLDRTATTA